MTDNTRPAAYVRRRELLRRLAFSLERLIELECLWLCALPSLEFKVALGHKIGHDAAALSLLDGRLEELPGEGPARLTSPGCEENAARAARLGDEAAAAGFLLTASVDLRRAMAALTAEGGLAGGVDEPTLRVLRAAASDLERGEAELGAAGPVPFALRPVDEGPAAAAPRRAGYALPPEPARPAGLARGGQCLLDAPTGELMKTLEGRRRMLFFFFIDIEIAASEVCAADVVLHPEMPLEFMLDMARQIWDEARHARFMLERFLALGGRLEGLTCDGSVWSKWSAGRTLAERLAIQQIAQEGNALDASASLAPAFRAVGDAETAEAFDFLVADEKNHALFGNKWLRRLLPEGADGLAFVDAAAARAGVAVPGRFPPDEALRAAAGFSEENTAEMRRRHLAANADPLRSAALDLAAKRRDRAP